MQKEAFVVKKYKKWKFCGLGAEAREKNIIWCLVEQFEETSRQHHQWKCRAEWAFICIPDVLHEATKHLHES